jgi:hypothetical protein
MKSEEELFHELSYYTLAHGDPAFIHQHIVDAYAAQHATEASKPIGVVYGLVGLYLHVEKQYTGREVQKAHMQLAKRRKDWPRLIPPKAAAKIGVGDVVKTAAGAERDAMIYAWAAAVWESWRERRAEIMELVARELGVRE